MTIEFYLCKAPLTATWKETAAQCSDARSPYWAQAPTDFVQRTLNVTMNLLHELEDHVEDTPILRISGFLSGPAIHTVRERIAQAITRLKVEGGHRDTNATYIKWAERFIFVLDAAIEQNVRIEFLH
jgi:hypothetical protein